MFITPISLMPYCLNRESLGPNHMFSDHSSWHVLLTVTLTYLAFQLSVCALQDICHNGSIPFTNYFTYNTMPTRSHSLCLLPPLSTIDPRCYSYFVHVCFVWNQISIDILRIENHNSFCHATYKHFHCTFLLLTFNCFVFDVHCCVLFLYCVVIVIFVFDV